MVEGVNPEDNKDIRLSLDPEALATAILKASSLLVDRSDLGREYVDKKISDSLAARYGAEYAESLKVSALLRDNLGTYDEFLAEAIKGDDAKASIFWHNDGQGNISFNADKLNAIDEMAKHTIPMVKTGDDWQVSG